MAQRSSARLANKKRTRASSEIETSSTKSASPFDVGRTRTLFGNAESWEPLYDDFKEIVEANEAALPYFPKDKGDKPRSLSREVTEFFALDKESVGPPDEKEKTHPPITRVMEEVEAKKEAVYQHVYQVYPVLPSPYYATR